MAHSAACVLDENEPNLQGEFYNESFWVHRAPRSQPMVHVSFSRRPKSFFRERHSTAARLRPGRRLAVTFAERRAVHDTCFANRQASELRQCPLNLYEVLRTLGEMGATYPDVVELLRQAQTCERLTCQLAVDALPQRPEVYQLALTGASDLDFQKDRDEIRNAEADFTSTPTLFERGPKNSRTAFLREQESSLREPTVRDETRSAERK